MEEASVTARNAGLREIDIREDNETYAREQGAREAEGSLSQWIIDKKGTVEDWQAQNPDLYQFVKEDPSLFVRMREFAKMDRNNEFVVEGNDEYYDEVLRMSERDRRENRAEIATKARTSLNEHQYGAVMALLDAASVGGRGVTINEGLTYLEQALGSAAFIDDFKGETGKTKMTAVQSYFTDRYVELLTMKGSEPIYQEDIIKIIDGIVQNVPVDLSWVGGIANDSEQPAYEVISGNYDLGEIPPEAVGIVTTWFTKQYGRAPTSAEVGIGYLALKNAGRVD